MTSKQPSSAESTRQLSPQTIRKPSGNHQETMIKQRANETTTNTTGLGEEAVVVGKLPLSAMINIFDFEKIARTEMLSMGKKKGGWEHGLLN